MRPAYRYINFAYADPAAATMGARDINTSNVDVLIVEDGRSLPPYRSELSQVCRFWRAGWVTGLDTALHEENKCSVCTFVFRGGF